MAGDFFTATRVIITEVLYPYSHGYVKELILYLINFIINFYLLSIVISLLTAYNLIGIGPIDTWAIVLSAGIIAARSSFTQGIYDWFSRAHEYEKLFGGIPR
ncbi:MAG: hypothetical protein J4432_03455 [DPANN group archaeon]|nr:hypothetical protein [DPANN group archaeon]